MFRSFWNLFHRRLSLGDIVSATVKRTGERKRFVVGGRTDRGYVLTPEYGWPTVSQDVSNIRVEISSDRWLDIGNT